MESREALALIIAAVPIIVSLTIIYLAKRRRSSERGSGNLRIDLNRDRGNRHGR
jgi:hypothetical protein